MSTSPNIKDFAAWINLQPLASPTLFVTGEVETVGGHLAPQLTRAEPQGIVAEQLILVLTIEDTKRPGTDDVAYRKVRYEQAAEQGSYTSVALRWDGEIIHVMDVDEAH